jgi:hypothetical protein
LHRLAELRRRIGGHQQIIAELHAGMHDLVLPFGRDEALGRRPGVGQHVLDLSAEDLLIELEGFLAVAVEKQVGVDRHDKLLRVKGFGGGEPFSRLAATPDR